ncbi:hypothetical cytosolic protein [Syntrophus aciditrophicus SB]|uniref:Hypothetical cytosolic protein n=1 Tax=Syntrophus aciditrophicus (strain SB) TaxID=56780 RepID=Q2LV58_SYNAS|nr:hypothetical cytosolic protein [Syntrophus aciditrophicus SB]
MFFFTEINAVAVNQIDIKRTSSGILQIVFTALPSDIPSRHQTPRHIRFPMEI